MSGGSWDYVYSKLEDLAEKLLREKCPFRRALGGRVSLLANAMYHIEWADSGDTAPGDEMPAVRKALGGDRRAVAAALAESAESARQAQEELAMLLSEAEAMAP